MFFAVSLFVGSPFVGSPFVGSPFAFLLSVAGPLADIVFWIAVAATVVAHGFILRSTIRGIRVAPRRGHVAWEWVWAILPALSMAVLFVYTWRAMHPDSFSILIPSSRINGITS